MSAWRSVRVAIALLVAVTGAVLMGAPGPQAQRPDRPTSRSPRSPRCAPPAAQRIYAPLPSVGWGDAELVLNNNRASTTTVHSRFFRAGTAYEGTSVTLGGSEARWLRLSELAGTAGRGLRGYEGVELSYDGIVLEVGAQLTLLRERGGTVDVPFSMAGDFKSNEQHAVWPAPPGARAVVLVGNSSDLPVGVIVESAERQTERQLEAFETMVIEIEGPRGGRAVSQSGVGWARVVTTGAPGSLRASGYVELKGQTLAGIRFYDPAMALQPNLYASNLAVADARPMLAVKNTGATAITVTPRFVPADGDAAAAVELPPLVLDAGMASAVDLTPLVRAAASRPELAQVSVAVDSTGGPGALIGGLSSIRRPGDIVSDVPLRDSGPVRQSTGTYPWRLDGDYNTVVSITNVSDGPARFHFQINFAGGEYARTMDLNAKATALFDLRQLRDAGVPDRKGRTIPQTATSGQFHWSILSSGGHTKLNGRADIHSVSARRSTSYSCPDCCPDSFGGAFLDPWEITVPIVDNGDFQVLAQYLNCYQQYYTVAANSVSAWWDVGSPAVTSVQNLYYGLSRASGDDGGTSSVWGYWDEELWHFAADYCWMETAPAQASGQVRVQVPTYVRIIGNPAYTDSPPPPYLYNVNREILDQNTPPRPIEKVMFVMESFSPDPPSANPPNPACTNLPVVKNNHNSDAGGTFHDEYTLDAGAPNPCSSSSTQSFKVRLNNVEYTIQTTYQITWQHSGVTVTCSAGCK